MEYLAELLKKKLSEQSDEEINRKWDELDSEYDNIAYEVMINEEQKQFIDKACEWLMDNVNNYIINDKSSGKDWLKVKSEMFDDFIKAMEE